ncbi:amidophosphoribosyltransferase [Allomyces arbusculus]|nr:amidophosphoribosyltransferase [Allomyces arbusculus]
MCGIAGLLLADANAQASAEVYEALGLLQHRGQDAAGMVTCAEKGRLYQCKGNGMVRDVFSEDKLRALRGSMAIGHVRYPTAGSSSTSEAQPFYVNAPYGIALAHNGNLTNAVDLRHFLDHEAHRHINTDSDSEILLNVLADHLQATGKFRINAEDVFRAVSGVFRDCKGGYACIALLAGFGIVAFRDPHGIRPCIVGSRPSTTGATGRDWMVASESVALSALDFHDDIADLNPGECLIVTKVDGQVHRRQLIPKDQAVPFAPCLFEYVYFARPDSILDGVSVYKARLAMGEALAHQVVKQLGKNHDIDVVIPVPDTSRVAGMQCAMVLNRPFREGLIKNRYIGRTFIMPGQSLRAKSVRRKLNAMALEFAGKNVLLVDDSVVRGTTSREIVQMARDAGARRVYFASCAPPVRYPNVYGIDMPSARELVAHGRTEAEVAKSIGADAMIYESLEDLAESVRKFNPKLAVFDDSVFTGKYVTGDVTSEYLQRLEDTRNDAAKSKPGSAVAGGKANGTARDGAVSPTLISAAEAVAAAAAAANEASLASARAAEAAAAAMVAAQAIPTGSSASLVGTGGLSNGSANEQEVGLHNAFHDRR